MRKLKIADFDSILNCKADLLYEGVNAVGNR